MCQSLSVVIIPGGGAGGRHRPGRPGCQGPASKSASASRLSPRCTSSPRGGSLGLGGPPLQGGLRAQGGPVPQEGLEVLENPVATIVLGLQGGHVPPGSPGQQGGPEPHGAPGQ